MESWEVAVQLQDYWTKLRNEVQLVHEGHLTNEVCLGIAKKVLNTCFEGLKLENRGLVLWWLWRSVVEIRDALFPPKGQPQVLNALTLERTKDVVIGCGKKAKNNFCSTKKDVNGIKHFAVDYLRRQLNSTPDGLTQQVLESVVDMDPHVFAHLLDKKLDVTLQASFTVMCFLRDDIPIVRGCLHDTREAFLRDYDGVTIRGNKRFLLNCTPIEETNLFFNCIFMRITHLYLPAHRNKGQCSAVDAF
jgi:hypothetical protein